MLPLAVKIGGEDDPIDERVVGQISPSVEVQLGDNPDLRKRFLTSLQNRAKLMPAGAVSETIENLAVERDKARKEGKERVKKVIESHRARGRLTKAVLSLIPSPSNRILCAQGGITESLWLRLSPHGRIKFMRHYTRRRIELLGDFSRVLQQESLR